MNLFRTHRSWREPPIVFQILVLLLGGLVVAQLVTLILTMVLPPAPPAQHDMSDVVGMLRGERSGGNLTRTVQAAPPDVSGTGWFTSADSRDRLAKLLDMPAEDVRLAFYAPLPFAGVAAPPPPGGPPPPAGAAVAPSPEADEPALRNIAWRVDPAPLHARLLAPPLLTLVVDQPGGGPGGAGGMPGGGFPGGGFSGDGFPGDGFPGRTMSQNGARGNGPNGRGGTSSQPQAGAAAISRDLQRSAPAPSPGDLKSQPFAPGVQAERSEYSGSPPASSGAPASGPGISSRPPSGAAAGGLAVPGMAGRNIADPGFSWQPVPVETTPTEQAKPAAVAPPVRPITPPASHPAPIAAPPASAPAPQQVQSDDLSATAPTRRPPTVSHTEIAGMPTVPIPSQGKALFGLAPAPFVEGDFVAAMRMKDGRWVVVQPAAEGFPNAWQRRVLLWFLVAFAFVAPIGWLYARHIVRPLGQFTAAAEQLGRDPSAALVALEGPAEIGRAAHAFNVMQSRLRSFVDDRTAMVGAISHDLRTPLTRLRFRIEEVEDEHIRDGMNDEVTEMEAMITSVLTFIRDASTPNVRERLDLGLLVEDVAQDAKLIGSDVRIATMAPAPVEIDVLGMRRLLTNLVENAVKYGERARIRLAIEDDAAVAEIQDDGPGIPDDEMERAFEPFYRASNAAESGKKGTGLGLAVCRSIARAHGGDVVLVRSSAGFAAQLRLPLAYDTSRIAA